jgi:hypothetical protein
MKQLWDFILFFLQHATQSESSLCWQHKSDWHTYSLLCLPISNFSSTFVFVCFVVVFCNGSYAAVYFQGDVRWLVQWQNKQTSTEQNCDLPQMQWVSTLKDFCFFS